MMRAMIVAAWMVACGAGCDTDPIPMCDAGAFSSSGDFAVSLRIVRAPARAATFDGGVAVPLRICARIPCLTGTTRATVTTSSGTIASASNANITLATGTNGQLQGDFELTLATGRSARVIAQIGESTASRDVFFDEVSAPVDGGTAPSSSTDDPCAALDM
jgi:hypothetical protein